MYDASVRRVGREIGDGYAATPAPSNVEFYVYEGLDRIAIFTPTVVDGGSGSPNTIIVKESYLFDGIDHPLRINRAGATVYYELDLRRPIRVQGEGSPAKPSAIGTQIHSPSACVTEKVSQ